MQVMDGHSQTSDETASQVQHLGLHVSAGVHDFIGSMMMNVASMAVHAVQDVQRAHLSSYWERGAPRSAHIAGEADAQREEGGAAPHRDLCGQE